jgi:hypothetical protein
MPTHEEEVQFRREFAALSPAMRARFLDAMHKMVNDLKAGQPFRPSLRVKSVQGHPDVFEMSWAPDGHATFHYGTPVRPGDAHIVWRRIWRRIGGHEILKNP